MLSLHCLIWFQNVYQIFDLRDRLEIDQVYAIKLLNFFDHIIECFILFQIKFYF